MSQYNLDEPVPPLHVSPQLSDDDRRQLVRWMITAREFDHAMIRLYRQGRALGGVYAQIGNEATSVGASYALDRSRDVIFPMHRDIGMHFVFGAPLDGLMLNFMARQGSSMRGTDGTGHYADPARRIYGNISHLAAMMPVAAGFALAARMRKENIVVLTTIGDGGSNVGEFHEAMNFAAVQKLPLLVIIENNQYAYSTPRELEYACERLSDRAIGYGCPGSPLMEPTLNWFMTRCGTTPSVPAQAKVLHSSSALRCACADTPSTMISVTSRARCSRTGKSAIHLRVMKRSWSSIASPTRKRFPAGTLKLLSRSPVRLIERSSSHSRLLRRPSGTCSSKVR